jgi:hypothetical protein
LIVATDGVAEDQVVCAVTFWVEPSEYCTAAVNCWLVPLAIEAAEGVMTKPCGVTGALVTVSWVLPETVPYCAWIVVVPVPAPVASPLMLPIVATPVVDEVQVAPPLPVRFCVEPSV